MIAFGPVPSRRLGRSLGINNIPPKVCSYSCVYCQVGRTKRMQVDREDFYEPTIIAQHVQDKVREASDAGEPIDHLTFVADGEPTLDANLGYEIDLLRRLGLKIAVITNASLVCHKDVRQDLSKADWVSLKVDSVRRTVWRKVNRPHGALGLDRVLNGILEFAEVFDGTLATETMLVRGVNDGEEDMERVGQFLCQVQPAVSYISIPTRPPAEAWVRPPDEQAINRAYQVLSTHVARVECLTGYEGDTFAPTGNVEEDLLSITAVHPMREQAVREFLAQVAATWDTIEDLKARGRLVAVEYGNETFYMTKVGHAPGGR